MNKFWVVGTSSKKYINEFIKLLKKFKINIGDHFVFNCIDKNYPIFQWNEMVIAKFNSYSVARQRLDVWEGMGLIVMNNNGYKIIFDKPYWDKIVDFTKLNILDITNSIKANEYRYTTIISTLVYLDILNNVDINKLKLKQSRGEISIEKIKKTISLYEEQLSEDRKLVEKMKERIWNV